MSVIAWNCQGLGSSLADWTLTEEVRAKEPLLVFLSKTKAEASRIKGIQNKLEYIQGITVPSDERSGGLAMLWRKVWMCVLRAIPTHISMWRFMKAPRYHRGVRLASMVN